MRMKFISCIIIILGLILVSCNDDVFVPRPGVEEPPSEPGPGSEPEITDSLMLVFLTYQEETLKVVPELEKVWEYNTTYFNNGDKPLKVYLLNNNYDPLQVKISNWTSYVIPWAKQQPEVLIPSFEGFGQPGFYGKTAPFKFGINTVKFEQDESAEPEVLDSYEVPPYSKVKAKVLVRRMVVTAKADIEYCFMEYPESLMDGWVEVTVSQAVDIKVEWSDVTDNE